MAYSTSIADNAQQSVAGQKRTANVEQSTSLLSNLMGETTVTQRWVVSYKYNPNIHLLVILLTIPKLISFIKV